MTRPIGICGYARSGKTTLAKAIKAELDGAACIVPFAAPVKRIAIESFGWDGKKDERGRRLLQVIGTEAGRAYDPDIWIDAWSRELSGVRNPVRVIADDVRFANEAARIHQLGGVVIRVDRPGYTSDGHASETIDFGVDRVFANDGNMIDLRTRARAMVRELMR